MQPVIPENLTLETVYNLWKMAGGMRSLEYLLVRLVVFSTLTLIVLVNFLGGHLDSSTIEKLPRRLSMSVESNGSTNLQLGHEVQTHMTKISEINFSEKLKDTADDNDDSNNTEKMSKINELDEVIKANLELNQNLNFKMQQILEPHSHRKAQYSINSSLVSSSAQESVQLAEEAASASQDDKGLEARGEIPANDSPDSSEKCLQIPQRDRIQPVSEQECNAGHVIIHHGGRLGNKMCQYVSLLLLRHIFGIRVSITEKMKGKLSPFFANISLPVQDFVCFPKQTERITYDDLYNLLYSRVTSQADVVLSKSLMDRSYYIYHHPCPRSVIMANRDLVRSALTFKDEVIEKAKENVDQALRDLNSSYRRDNVTLVTVHVRRRDYSVYIVRHYNLSQLNEVYFERAFNYYRERVRNPVFVVVSDDHPWCVKALSAKDVVVAGSKKDPIIDLAVLSLGDHTIISYGTFSFMGAILAKGTIAHPVNGNKIYDHFNCVKSPSLIPIFRDALST